MNINNHDPLNLPRGPHGGHIHPSKRFVTFSKHSSFLGANWNKLSGFDSQNHGWESGAMHDQMTGKVCRKTYYGDFTAIISVC